MYMIGLILFILFMAVLMFFVGNPMAFVDFPSLVVILTLSFSILSASGLVSDFFKGFKLMGQKVNPYTLLELKKIVQACQLAIYCFLLSGFVGTLVGSISLLSVIKDPKMIAPSLAVALLTSLYALLFVFIVLPVHAKAKVVISTME